MQAIFAGSTWEVLCQGHFANARVLQGPTFALEHRGQRQKLMPGAPAREMSGTSTADNSSTAEASSAKQLCILFACPSRLPFAGQSLKVSGPSQRMAAAKAS